MSHDSDLAQHKHNTTMKIRDTVIAQKGLLVAQTQLRLWVEIPLVTHSHMYKHSTDMGFERNFHLMASGYTVKFM